MQFKEETVSETIVPIPILDINPRKETVETSPAQVVNLSAIITNNSEETLDNLTYEITPYSYDVKGGGYKENTNYDSSWQHYNDIVGWAEIDNYVTTLDPGESAKIDYHITVPSCVASDYQWMALIINSQDETSDEYTATLGRAIEIIEAKIENNDASECGGTADDPYPYITVVNKISEDEKEEYTYRYDSEEYAELFKDYPRKKTNSPTTCVTDDLGCEEPSSNTSVFYIILGIVVSAAIVFAAIVLIVKTIAKIKTKPTPPTTPPTTPQTPTPPATPSSTTPQSNNN